MSDPLFAVPLSALVYFEPYGTEFHWTCTLPGGSGGYDPDGDYVVCDRRIDASSEAAARAAAVAHLESVHGIHTAGEPVEPVEVCEWCRHEIFIHVHPECPMHRDNKKDGISW